MIAKLKKAYNLYSLRNINLWIIFYFLVYLVLVIKLITIKEIDNNILFGLYSLGVSLYLLSRFVIAYFYEVDNKKMRVDYLPTISFGVPAKNEEDNIRETILKMAKSDYPKNKFDIIAVNDGSTDNTLQEMLVAKEIAARHGAVVKVIDWKENRGKREGMAECVKMSKKDLVIFVDSDSFVNQSTARNLVKYFSDPQVVAVAGQAYVTNENKNYLTKMQSVRYYIAFKAYKAAEAMFNSVTCCSGCCSAYRRQAVMEVLADWGQQRFLGIACTYGDDRSLTNFLLRRGYKTLFAEEAICHTMVPDNFRQFMRQQLSWKKSWVRESLIASTFIWRRNIIMSLSFYLGFILPLAAPIIVLRALVWYPYMTGLVPCYYLLGLMLMSLIYGLYYYIHTRDRKWFYGVLFAVFYTLVLIWQLPWAIINIRDSRWGTR